MARLNVKYTIWESWDVPEGTNLEELAKAIKDNDHGAASKLIEDGGEGDYPEWEYIDGSDTYLDPKDNGGYATMELQDDSGNVSTTNELDRSLID